MKLLFFDLETTGTNPGRNGIHQISGMVEIDGVEKERFDFHVQPNPKALIEEQALAVQTTWVSVLWYGDGGGLFQYLKKGNKRIVVVLEQWKYSRAVFTFLRCKI